LRYTLTILSPVCDIVNTFFAKKQYFFADIYPMGFIEFYDRVKSLVKINKMTIENVVNQAGLSLSSYNAYRRHENLPRADEAQKIAYALGTTVEYLVTGEDGLEADERELMATFKGMNDDGKKAALAALRGFAAAYPKKGKESGSLTA
jgi:transcriptional regulator with XRE-family HTH domain